MYTGGLSPGTIHSAMFKKKITGTGTEKGIRMTRGVQFTSYESMLEMLGLFDLANRRIRREGYNCSPLYMRERKGRRA